MTDRGTVNQSAGDHGPTSCRLGDEEQTHHKIDAEFLERNGFFEKKVKHRDGIDQTCQAGDKAVDPFHIEYKSIFLKIHVEVDLFELGCLLVLGKFIPPGLLANRWDSSTDRIPFGNGKAGAGETDKSPEDNQEGHDEGKEKEPVHHGVVTGLRHILFLQKQSRWDYSTALRAERTGALALCVLFRAAVEAQVP